MRWLLARRAVATVGVLFALSIVVFIVRAILPADPVRAMVGASASVATVERERHLLGFDQPLPAQYLRFLVDLFHGDLGMSLMTRRPVVEDILAFGPATLELAFFSALLGGLLALVLGYWSAREGRGADVLRVVMTGLASVPTFAVAIVLILALFAQLNWLPASGQLSDTSNAAGPTGLLVLDAVLQLDGGKLIDALAHLVIPCVCLSLIPAVAIGRVLRGALQDVLRQDYVRTARAKGLSERRVLLRHGLRNAAGPVLSMAGLQAGVLLSGVVVVENVTAWPGLGRYASNAIQFADFPAITGVVLVLGFAYVFINFLIDVLQIVADPRLRASLELH